MSTYKSFNEIVQIMLEQLKLVQPNLDTKPGTVSRDLFIDLQADQLEKLYKLISVISDKQSPSTAVGNDLDRYASNYNLSRKTGSFASGVAIFTINSIPSDIQIPSGTLITAKSGVTFKVVGNYIFSATDKNRHASTASRIKKSLQIAGISDKYAIEVPIQATRVGTSSNVSSLQLTTHSLDFDIKVINLSATSGGENGESDSQFRTRISTIFSGANTGTALGYKNAILNINGINDALIVQPGNTLMLRDGTEIIEIDDGTRRILSSGTGGKVDIYVLGKQLVEVSDSFIFTDMSGTNTIYDERNDYIIAHGSDDITMTAEERRIKALSSGSIPLQPVSNIVSVSGSSSGVLSPKTINSDGTISGNYELIKDTNIDTGGSPFCFDKLHFIANSKSVNGEVSQKVLFNGINNLNYSDISEISSVYSDINVIGENSYVYLSDRTLIKTLHLPVVSASSVINKTTGEVYTIESIDINSTTGISDSGLIKISGKNLPSQSDILHVSYIWRKYYDKYIDYNGSNRKIIDISKDNVDSIDWGYSNFISEEESLITRSEDDSSYVISTNYEISRVSSVSMQLKETLNVENTTVSGSQKLVVVVESENIDNVSKIIRSNGMEIYNTTLSDGYFSGKTIVLPSDTIATVGESLTVFYNKIEIFNIENTDASFYNSTIIVPSDGLLDSNTLAKIYDSYTSESVVYVSYYANLENILPKYSLSSAPFSGSEEVETLSTSSLTTISNSHQPIIFKYNSNSEIIGYTRFSPCNLYLNISDSLKSGKLKIEGTTLTRINTIITYGIDKIDNLKFDLSSYIKNIFDKNVLDSNYYLARIDDMYVVDDYNQKISSFDIYGYKLFQNKFDITQSIPDSSLEKTYFELQSNSKNNSISLSSGSRIYVSFLVAKENDYEDVYFYSNNSLYTSKIYSTITSIKVTSGFRTSAGNISGSLYITNGNQPIVGSSFNSNYKFVAPKEGERITIRYNVNRLLIDATNSIESVRPITADILIKEASEILIDVSGQILVNENQLENADFIVQNVADEISKLLSTNKLGSTIDYSDIISVATRVSGVDSINISLFNESGSIGRRSFIKSLDNQTINPGNIFLEAISRKDFRIS